MGICLDILSDWKPVDMNGDGHITGSDIGMMGFDPGSLNAKVAWEKIYTMAHTKAAIKKAHDAGYDTATGWYNGKPILPEVSEHHHATFGDYDLLRDRLIWYKGMEPAVVNKIIMRLVQNQQNNVMSAPLPKP